MATISSSETFAKRRAIFLSVRKTVNSQGYSELREPVKTRENCYPLIWQILISDMQIISHYNKPNLILKSEIDSTLPIEESLPDSCRRRYVV